jgi:hypothetical protein
MMTKVNKQLARAGGLVCLAGFAILLFVIANLSFAVAAEGGFSSVPSTGFSQSSGGSFINYQTTPGFSNAYTSADIQTYWPILEEEENCQARQDLILQVSPAGCQPAVVRSDLLEEQNVPVFCQISAIKINPFLDIKQINNIRFTGSYPSSVTGTAFHPAQAALRMGTNSILGSPVVDNIGYVVVVLKKTPAEKDMPEWVNMTLSAQVEYSAGNTFGIGKANFLLNETKSDAQWQNEKTSNTFWNGRYSIRLERDRKSVV